MNKNLKMGRKILISILFVICLFLLKNTNEVKAASYIWPVGGDNAYETYVDYEYYGTAGYAPVKNGKSGREYIVNNNLWPNELYYYNSCESHYGMDITGINGHTYKVVSVVEGTVIATNAEYGYAPNKICAESNQRRPNSCLYEGGGYGNYIIIQENSTGRCYIYAHLRGGTLKVSTGDNVHVGQEIATMGSSGDSGHMHLHFEIRVSRQATLNMSWGLGRHTFQIANSNTNLDPKDFIGTEAPKQKVEPILPQTSEKQDVEIKTVPAQIDKITFIRYSNFRQINIYFDKAVSVEVAPEMTIRVGDETKTAKFCGVDRDNRRLKYRVYYNEFDLFTSGKIYVDCKGTVKTVETPSVESECNFENVTVGELFAYKISNTFKFAQISKLGDVDLNGRINASDATLALIIYSKLATGETLTAEEKEQAIRADINQDGRVDSVDATAILSYYSGLSTGLELEQAKIIVNCDFNNDECIDVNDYNLLKAAVEYGAYDSKYDLDGNNVLNNDDLEYLKGVILKSGSRVL